MFFNSYCNPSFSVRCMYMWKILCNGQAKQEVLKIFTSIRAHRLIMSRPLEKTTKMIVLKGE